LFLLVFSSRERRETRRCLTAAPQTTRLSSSSTRRLVKVADIRLLRGKSLDTGINLLNPNTFPAGYQGYKFKVARRPPQGA
ncbi:MAG: hypothetical protein ACE5HR_09720, partial [bacterium]